MQIYKVENGLLKKKTIKPTDWERHKLDGWHENQSDAVANGS